MRMKFIKKYKFNGRRWNLRPRIPINKLYWDFHKGDADFNPSVPHGHSLTGRSLDGKYKLELWSGKIYFQSTGELFGIAKPKDILRLYQSDEFQNFVNECRLEYMKNNPHMKLPPLTDNPYITRARSVQISRYKSKRIRKLIKRYVVITSYDIKNNI